MPNLDLTAVLGNYVKKINTIQRGSNQIADKNRKARNCGYCQKNAKVGTNVGFHIVFFNWAERRFTFLFLIFACLPLISIFFPFLDPATLK